MSSDECFPTASFAECSVSPTVRRRPPRRWALLVAVALGVAGLYGYAFSLLAGLQIVLLVEEEPVELNLWNEDIGDDPVPCAECLGPVAWPAPGSWEECRPLQQGAPAEQVGVPE